MYFHLNTTYHEPKVTEDEPVAKSSLTRADSVDDMIAQVRTRMIMMRVKTNSKKVQKNCFVSGEASEPASAGGEERF